MEKISQPKEASECMTLTINGYESGYDNLGYEKPEGYNLSSNSVQSIKT